MDTSEIADADGLTAVAYSYQWVSYDGNDYTDIPDATASTHTLVSSDEGKAFMVKVSFTDDAGNQQSLTSELATMERPYGLSASESDGAVVLTWQLPVGWPYASTYQVLRNRPELGETEPIVHVRFTESGPATYTDADVEPGVLYVYRVKGVDFVGYAQEASEPVEIRTAAPDSPPVGNSPASGAPAISGTAQVGETLTVDTSGIADADGLTNTTFSYQWLSSEGTGYSEIVGATGSTYTVSDSDLGTTIAVRIDYTDDRGNNETLTSAFTQAVTILIWRSALTVEGGSSAQSGYSLPQGTGALSPGESSVGVADFIVRLVLTDVEGSLTLGLDRELSGPFTLQAGSVSLAYEDSLASASEEGAGYTYVWDQAGLDWSTGENVDLQLTTPEQPLTAVFESAPGSHDGSAEFTFDLRFSEELDLSYRTLRDHAFTVTRGSILKAGRLDRPSNIRWRITALPDSDGNVTIVLPITGDCADDGAICTEDGRMLASRVELTVTGPDG